MAKAKKTAETGAESASGKKAAPRKAPARKAGAKKSAAKPAAGAPAAPLIDTDLAAASAARMLLARASGAAAATPPPSGDDLKQLKEAVTRPRALDNLLHSTAPKSTSHGHLPHHPLKQVGHNQTFGADVTRTGVPRRTSTG